MNRDILASRHWPRQRLSWVLAFAFLAAAALTACSALRFPGLAESPGSTEIAPVPTPTWAPAVLTPAPTLTPEPTSAKSSPATTPTFGLLLKPTCRSTPMWGLGDVWKNERVYMRLGCPTGEQVGVQGEELHFQHGQMLSRPDAALIYVFLERGFPRGWGAYVDTYVPSDLDSDPTVVVPAPTPGEPRLVQPTGRFGKLWRENAWLREKLGWALADSPGHATTPIIPFAGAVQDFERGVLFYNGHVCFVLRTDDMSWDLY